MEPAVLERLIIQAKEELRKRIAGLRRAVPAEARARRASAACARLEEIDAFREAKVIAAYAPLKFELDCQPAVQAARVRGATIGLTRVVPGTSELTLHVHGADDELHESGFMVMEPAADAPRLDLASVDVVLVPGLGFDEQGQRLGFGKGFYDRFLPGLPNAVRIGLAFDFQLLAEVPATDRDAPLDWLVSDARVVRCKR